eukprot:s4573_g2.t1
MQISPVVVQPLALTLDPPESISRRRSVVSLRATGHLLVGACKIYVKKCSIFEEEAEEVRTALMMAFSRPTDMQAAEEMAPIREVRTHTAPPDQVRSPRSGYVLKW